MKDKSRKLTDLPAPPPQAPEALAKEQINAGAMICKALIEHLRNNPSLDQRLVSIGATEMQKGFAMLRAAIDKPEF